MASLLIMPYEHCYKAIEIVARSKGFTEYDVNFDNGSSKGDNIMGEIWRASVKEKTSKACLYLIIKAATIKDAVRDNVPLDIIYKREIFAYEEVLTTMNKIQDSVVVSPVLKFSFVNCYYTSEEYLKEILVLEDLRNQGFVMLDKMKGMDLEHASVVVTSLAKLHAFSFILKDREPQIFNRFVNKMSFDTQARIQGYANFIRTSLDLAAKVVDNDLHKSKILQIRDNYFDIWKKCLQVDSYSVICHGDCWTNNVMFKTQDGKPMDVILFDYQVMRYAPPLTDFLFFFFTSTDGELRRAHYSTCLNLYHEFLADVLKAYSYNVEEVFPREEFDKQLKKVAKLAFISGICACKHMVLDSEDNMEVCDFISGHEMAPPKGAAYDRYVKKLSEVISDCIKFGYV